MKRVAIGELITFKTRPFSGKLSSQRCLGNKPRLLSNCQPFDYDSRMLTTEQVEQYHRDGYVTPAYRLPDIVLDDIRAAHDRLIQRHPEFSDYCSALLAFDTWYLTVARIPEILDMVAQVIGDDIALWNSSFFAKPARVGNKTPWHQDGEYWPIRPLATCTVWIAIDASTTKNGCLRVIPGSHRSKRLA